MATNNSFFVVLIALAAAPALASESKAPSWWAILPLSAVGTGIFTLVKTRLDRKHDERRAEARAEFERRQAKTRNAFEWSVTSHMAIQSFDKYVEFCEAYLAKVDEALIELMHSGSGEKALKYVVELAAIRRKYALWEPADVGQTLVALHLELNKIGIAENTLKHGAAIPFEQRHAAFNQVFEGLNKLLGVTPEENLKDDDMTRDRLLKKFREKLGADRFSELRRFYLDQALEHVGSSQV